MRGYLLCQPGSGGAAGSPGATPATEPPSPSRTYLKRPNRHRTERLAPCLAAPGPEAGAVRADGRASRPRGHRLLPSCARGSARPGGAGGFPRARASPNGAEKQSHSSTNNNRGAPQTQSPEGFLGRDFAPAPGPLLTHGWCLHLASPPILYLQHSSAATCRFPPASRPPSELKHLFCAAQHGLGCAGSACKGQQRSTPGCSPVAQKRGRAQLPPCPV